MLRHFSIASTGAVLCLTALLQAGGARPPQSGAAIPDRRG